MLKLIAAIRRKPGMTHADCVHYLRTTHASLARSKPLGVKKYVQNFVFDGAYGEGADATSPSAYSRDSVTELWFESLTDMGRTFADSYTSEVIGPDGQNFSDLPSAIGLLTREDILLKPRLARTSVKIMQFFRLKNLSDLPALQAKWQTWHEQAVTSNLSFAKAIRGYCRSIRTPEGDPFLAYFGGRDASDYHGVASLWLRNEKSLPLFRQYHDTCIAAAAHDDILDLSRSFFIYVRENTVMENR